MGDVWMSLLDWCGTAPTDGGIALSLFVAGAIGGAAHCAPMCGGFVLGQVADRMGRLPAHHLCEWRRFQVGSLVPYHLGRLTTYAALGASAGIGGSILTHMSYLAVVPLLVAATLLLGRSIRTVPVGFGGAWGMRIRRGVSLVARDGGGYWFGVCLGFLPCGFLYTALLGATATGRPLSGALAMIAFGLGTVPALIVVGVVGGSAGPRWRGFLVRHAQLVMAGNGVLLLALAGRRLVAG